MIDKNINNINICTSVDKKYLPHLLVMINSVIKNTKSHINFYILSRDFDTNDKDNIKKLFSKFSSINIIDMDSFFEKESFLLPEHIESKSTMDRLLITSILKGVKKVIYLDVDLVVNTDISEMYSFDTGEKGICARVCNPGVFRSIRGSIQSWVGNDLNIIKDFPDIVDEENDNCFNAGVMLLDLEKMKKNSFEKKVLSMIYKHPINDQIILNLYTNGQHAFLPASWNFFASQDDEKKIDKNIIHWIGPNKPWNSNSLLSEYWYFYFDIIRRFNNLNRKENGSLWAITTFFNPVGYKNKKENYNKFRESSKRQGLKLIAVELEFGDYPFELKEDDAEIVIHIRGNKNNIMWQKERLLNIGLKSLPKDCDKVVWIDCDIIFQNENWVQETSDLLDKYAVVQPFDKIFNLSKNSSISDIRSFLFGKGENKKAYGVARLLNSKDFGNFHCEPGYVWSIRKEIIDIIGFYDKSVVGDGDSLMLFAFLNKSSLNDILSSDGFRDDYNSWARIVFKYIDRKKIFYTKGNILHLWHGNMKDRIYMDRSLIIRKNKYNPKTDIEVDKNGIWKWSSDKKELHNDLIEYFSLRNEENSFLFSFSRTIFNLKYLPFMLGLILRKKFKNISFDWKEYIEANSDLRAMWNSPFRAFLHYYLCGRREKRPLGIKK